MKRAFLIIILIILTNFLFAQTNALDKTNCIPGTIGGSVDVSPSGAATYYLPIQVSPGSNGMQPNIGIAYSSQSENGLLGWGWNLTGLSSISRSPKNMYYDNTVDAITLTNNDAFLLDGARLIADAANVYHPANNPYTMVVKSSYGFTVTTQDGVVMEYGKEGNSQFFTLNGTVPIIYAISRITDPRGNYIQFIYEGSSANGEFRISEINYTGNSLENKAPYNSVKFTYANRTDIENRYIAGGKLIQSVLLTSIKVYCEESLSKDYEFTYVNDQYSKLNKIALVADGVSYNPTIVNWGATASYSTYESQGNPPLGDSHNYKLYSGDFNGDGLVDIAKWNRRNTILVSISQPGGVYTSKSLGLVKDLVGYDTISSIGKDIQVLDRNNDGKDEILVHSRVYTSSSTPVPNYISRVYTFSSGNFTYQTESINSGGIFKYFYCDLNNDGAIDRITVKNRVIFSCQGLAMPSTSIGDVDNIMFMDFDGDGRMDMLTLSNEGPGKIWEYTGTDFVNRLGSTSRFFGKSNSLFNLGDFNGDGKTDYISYYSEAWHLFYSTGTGFVEGVSPDLYYCEPFVKGVPNRFFTANEICIDDINSDGKSEICQVVGDVVSGYILKDNVFNKYSLHVDRSFNIEGVSLQSVDLDNDGQKELVYGKQQYDENDTEIPVITPYERLSFQPTLKNNLYVNAIVDGLNNTYTFNYYTYNSATFPKPTFPLALVSGPWQLVKKMKTTSGGVEISNINYSYGNGYSHINGLGFLGFKMFAKKDIVTTDSSIFNFEYAIAGANGIYSPWLSSQKTFKGGVESSVTNTMEVKKFDLSTKSFFPVVISSKSVNGFTNVTTTTTITGFNESIGRATEQTVSVGGYSIINSYGYETFGSNGCRLKSTSEKRDGTLISNLSFTYNSLNQLIEKNDVKHSILTKYADFDAFGNIKRVNVISGGTTRSASCDYDDHGRFVVQSTDVLGNISKADYRHSDGAKLWEENSLGNRTTYSYSFSNGSLVSAVNTPDGNVVNNSLEWDNLGIAAYTTQKKLNGNTTQKSYFNAIGQKVKEEVLGYKDSWVTSTFTYNERGALSSQSTLGFSTPTTYSYTPDGRIKSVTGLNKSISYSYAGLSQTITDNIANTTQTQTYDVLGNALNTRGTMGDVDYSYNPTGTIKQIVAAGAITTMEYDEQGNQTKLVDPNSGTTTYTYNSFGQLLTQTDANGNTITCTYDANGLLTKKSGIHIAESYVYDTSTGKNGRLTSSTRNGVCETYTYDGLGRVSQIVTSGDGKTFTSTNEYNSIGQLYKVTQPTGLVLQYSFDKAWNITQISSPSNPTSPLWVGEKTPLQQWDYYSLGNNLKTKFGYDGNYMLTSIKTGIASNETSVQNLGFTFNTKGQLTSRTDGSSLSEAFLYDVQNRLKTSTVVFGQSVYTTTSSYLSNGNISSTSFAGDYSYDASHVNAVKEVNSSASVPSTHPEFTTYSSFTIDNRIDSMYNANCRNRFTYGPSGNRFKVEHKQGDAVYSKIYVGSSEFIYNSTDTIKRTMIYAPTGICAVWEKKGVNTDSIHYVHTDYLGSWLQITDKNGNVENSYSYDAWGRPRNPSTWALTPIDTASALVNLNAMQPRFDRGYTGHEHMAGFGLINMNGRLYDPYLQRFLSPDNVVQAPDNAQNYNRYTYCLNNPLMYTDPTGWLLEAKDHSNDRFVQDVAPLATWHNPRMDGSGGPGGGFVDALLGAVHSGYTGSMNEFSYLYNQATNSPDFDGTIRVQTGIMDYHAAYYDKNNKLVVTDQIWFSKPIYSTIRVTNSTGGKTNFYDSNLNPLVSFESSNDRAVVIPTDLQKNVNHAINQYKDGKLSSNELFNVLNGHGNDWNIIGKGNDWAVIGRPRDFVYYIEILSIYLGKATMYKGQNIDMPYDNSLLEPYNGFHVKW